MPPGPFCLIGENNAIYLAKVDNYFSGTNGRIGFDEASKRNKMKLKILLQVLKFPVKQNL